MISFRALGNGKIIHRESISKLTRRSWLAGLAASGFFPAVATAQGSDTTEVMVKNFESTRFTTSTYAATMEIGRPGEDPRRRALLGATKLLGGGAANAQLVRFTSPSDLNRTATLTISRLRADDDLWVYLPSLKKVRRLVSSNRRDAYVGSDFSFGDILGFEVEEWTHRFLPGATIGGEPCWVIESTPASEAVKRDYGYSKRVSWIRKSNYVLKRGEYYGLAGQLLKRVQADQVKAFGASQPHFQPMLVSAETIETGRISTIRFSSFEADVQVADADVAPGALDR